VKRSFPKVIAVVCFLLLSGFPSSAEEGLEDRSADARYTDLSVRLEAAEKELAAVFVEDHPTVTAGQAEALAILDEEIRSSLYGDLIDKSGLLLYLTREQMRFQQKDENRDAIVQTVIGESLAEQRREKRSNFQNKALRISMGSAVASFTLAFTLWGLGEMQDRLYFEAQTIDQAVVHRRFFQVFSIGSLFSAAVGVISSGISVYLLAAGSAR
jgi:hypothetical protein